MSVNEVTLVGYVGKDAEARYMPDGTCITTFSLATTETFRNRDNVRKEETEWHRLVVHGKPAESAKEHVKKGKFLYVKGRIKTRDWTDKDGVKKYVTEILVKSYKFLGPRTDSAEPQQRSAPPNSSSTAPVSGESQSPAPSQPSSAGGKSLFDDDESDDLPF